jgi:hypothetical protein
LLLRRLFLLGFSRAWCARPRQLLSTRSDLLPSSSIRLLSPARHGLLICLPASLDLLLFRLALLLPFNHRLRAPGLSLRLELLAHSFALCLLRLSFILCLGCATLLLCDGLLANRRLSLPFFLPLLPFELLHLASSRPIASRRIGGQRCDLLVSFLISVRLFASLVRCWLASRTGRRRLLLRDYRLTIVLEL